MAAKTIEEFIADHDYDWQMKLVAQDAWKAATEAAEAGEPTHNRQIMPCCPFCDTESMCDKFGGKCTGMLCTWWRTA